MKNRIFGFKNAYPQDFLDKLANILGIKWTKVEFRKIPTKDIKIKPLDKPSGILHYFETVPSDINSWCSKCGTVKINYEECPKCGYQETKK